MSMFRGLDISASGLGVERTRMDIIAQNIANVETTSDGGTPYRRKEVVLSSVPWTKSPAANSEPTAGGVQVAQIREDTSPFQMVYRPQDPNADGDGYVKLPNVNLPLEMVDMVAATRAYEANAAALRANKEIIRKALDILR